jgi:hypothetical protein
MPSKPLTQADIDKLQRGVGLDGKPITGNYDAWDKKTIGLGVRIRAGGTRTWVYQYRDGDGGTRKTTIDHVGRMPRLDDARDAAFKLAAGIRDGIYPHVEKAEAKAAVAAIDDDPTLGSLIPDFLRWFTSRARKSQYAKDMTKALMQDWAPLHGLRLAQIDRHAIGRVIDQMIEDRKGHGKRNGLVGIERHRGMLRQMFSWVLRHRRSPVKITLNPVKP